MSESYRNWADVFFSWVDNPDENDIESHELAWNAGRKSCKEEILRILKQDIQNCDLSWETVDSRFIKKIEEL